MSWDHFVIFAMAALLCWAIGAVAAWKEKRQFVVYAATLAGLAVFLLLSLGCGFHWNGLRCVQWVKPDCGILSFYLWRASSLIAAGDISGF